MPQEVRQYHSGALIFVPTKEEQLYTEASKQLNKELEEVKELKQELLDLIKENKKE